MEKAEEADVETRSQWGDEDGVWRGRRVGEVEKCHVREIIELSRGFFLILGQQQK